LAHSPRARTLTLGAQAAGVTPAPGSQKSLSPRASARRPDIDITSPTFGKITQPQGKSRRNIQLGLKFYF